MFIRKENRDECFLFSTIRIRTASGYQVCPMREFFVEDAFSAVVCLDFLRTSTRMPTKSRRCVRRRLRDIPSASMQTLDRFCRACSMLQFNKRKQCCHTHIVWKHCFLLHFGSRHYKLHFCSLYIETCR